LPASSPWGLTHNDFCAANLVIGEDSRLFSIDNELFARGFLEYDVARVWYRWPMPAWAERRFLGRYRSVHSPIPPDAEQLAWRVVATLKGAHLRHRIGAPNDHALALLRRLLLD
jgi:thiamine kinase-like enzyme